MTDIYIKTPTPADYTVLVRLTEAAGYTWEGGRKPSELKLYQGENTVVHLDLGSKNMWQALAKYYNDVDYTIETITNLADIKAIYRFENEESFNLFHETHDKHLSVTSHKNPFAIQYSDGSVLFDYESTYKALAVEYKPKESEVMPEKVKLPKEVCDYLDENKKMISPFYKISELNSDRELEENDIQEAFADFVNVHGYENQWKIIDALRYGYEPEPEQLYYVWFIRSDNYSFLNLSDSDGLEIADNEEDEYIKTRFTMNEIIVIDPRYKEFAVPVEEVNNV